MKLVRIFTSGFDVRSHTIAEWKCDVCGYVHWDSHINEASYDKKNAKKCPKCGSLSFEDRIHTLKLRDTELSQKQLNIQKEQIAIRQEIYSICKELETRCSATGAASKEGDCEKPN